MVSQLIAPAAVLCAVTAVYQERKEQTATVDEGTMGLHEGAGAVSLFQLPHGLRCGF